MEPTQHHHPYSTTLRQRAARLAALAAAIERLQVLALPEHARASRWGGRRAQLAVTMLDHNLHQLHRAADDLRSTAHRFRVRADELDRARRAAA